MLQIDNGWTEAEMVALGFDVTAEDFDNDEANVESSGEEYSSDEESEQS